MWDLVLFLQFKKREELPWRSVTVTFSVIRSVKEMVPSDREQGYLKVFKEKLKN